VVLCDLWAKAYRKELIQDVLKDDLSLKSHQARHTPEP